MQTTIDQKVKIPRINGQTLSLRQSYQKAGVGRYWCSDYLPSLGLLAEGECDNPESGTRNAKVVITDFRTGELKGGEVWREKLSTSLYLLF